MNKINLMPVKFIFLLSLSFLLSNVNAQTKTAIPTKPISSGVVNGKAVSLPKPVYPAAIDTKPRPAGTINVQVLIDEEGSVVSAKAISGIEDISFRQAAEIAALQAKFLPTTLSGKPVKVSGVIVYNFVDGASNEERMKIFGLSTLLHMLKNSASNLDQLSDFLESKDFIKESSDEFSEYANEINQLGSLEKLSVEERLIKINDITSLVKSKLNTSEKWQFELGKNFAGIISQLIELKNADNFDPAEFDETNLKNHLSEIKELTKTAPMDFPPDVLEGLKNLATESEKEKIITAENVDIFFGKMEKLFDAISPNSTK